MDNVAFHELVDAVTAGCKVIGIAAEEILAGDGTVVLGETGLDVWWVPDALGKGKPGWQVRENFHVIHADKGEMEPLTKVIGAFEPKDAARAAKLAVMTVVEARIHHAIFE